MLKAMHDIKNFQILAKMEPQTMYEWIENYLAGNLSEAEEARFKEKMRQDPVFAREVALFGSVQEAITDKKTPAFEALLKEIEATADGATGAKLVAMPKKRNWLRPVAAAASVAIILVAAWLVLMRSDTPADQFAALSNAYKTEQLQVTTRGASAEKTLQEGAALYNKGNYAAALPLLDAYLRTPGQTEDPEVRLAKAICLSNTGRYDEAISEFETIEKAGGLLQPKANWYKTLSTGKKGDTAAYRNLLKAIIIANNNYSRPAGEILKTLP
jgi:tetratricopeptide (TPR) repeat protein